MFPLCLAASISSWVNVTGNHALLETLLSLNTMALAISAELEKQMDEVITHYPMSKRSAVLPLLHLMQEHFRFISDEIVNWVAAKLSLEPIQVLEVVTFYPGFRQVSSRQIPHSRLPHPFLCHGWVAMS
jgi:NADH:ubiquinone oxidoreductase subunit E